MKKRKTAVFLNTAVFRVIRLLAAELVLVSFNHLLGDVTRTAFEFVKVTAGCFTCKNPDIQTHSAVVFGSY